jgi:hypothetical protein
MIDVCERLILERMRMTRLEYNGLHDVLCAGGGTYWPAMGDTMPLVLPDVYFESREAVYPCIKECYFRLGMLRICLEKSRLLRKIEHFLPEEVLYKIVTHDIKDTDTNLINNHNYNYN